MSFSSKGDRPSDTPTSSSRSGSHTPQNPANSNSYQSAASYFSYPVSHVVSGLYRRLTDPSIAAPAMPSTSSWSSPDVFTPPPNRLTLPTTTSDPSHPHNSQKRRPPPAATSNPRTGRGDPPPRSTAPPTRRELALDRDGASLATLYDNCEEFSHRSPRAGYVLVIRDSSPTSAVFGAYMTDAPHPNSQFFGTGECFLWRASVLPPPSSLGLTFPSDGPQSEEALERAGLPPPPSADTTHAGRWSTLRNEPKSRSESPAHNLNLSLKTSIAAASGGALAPPSPSSINTTRSGASTPERIRFKAFPYSGVNDYMMFCETGFLSLGGGDGHYGLWVDSGLEKGVSAPSQTFGNEPLSDEGIKFDILGVEVWYVGS
ncbi:TLDc [Penicillium frequentans]|uniref:Oxidation resistance protein 1 n=1 Tax=Penicillium frequentans TaxID=3151616 RepID=A0AAD6CWE0_9EURO|nr:TLDc [Penicillium glabrum]